jgi:NAD(P)-dependent dehydrogenase (short-subunit alcohol dehydrogenase family)
MSLEGKSVVVTGGAGGLGRYIAVGCAERGANVTIGDISAAMLESADRELAGFGHGVVARHCDVRVEADAKALMDVAASAHGGIDYLVNNAGIAPQQRWHAPWPDFKDMDVEFWDKVFDTNVHGLFNCSKHAIPYMEAKRAGHIANVHNFQGGEIAGSTALYPTTKKAALSFTRFLAEQEREFNICVMSVNPGSGFATETAPEEVRAQMPGPEITGERFFQAADAPMCLSGRLVSSVANMLVPIDYNFEFESMALVPELAHR